MTETLSAALRVFQALDELDAGRTEVATSLLERAAESLCVLEPTARAIYEEHRAQ